MKYDISDLLNNKNSLGYTMLRIHKKANKGVLALLILKQTVYHYFIIHFLFIIISSMGLLILCSDFFPNYDKYFYFSNWLRYLTPYYIVKKFKITHTLYLIICGIIFIICFSRIISIINFTYRINHFNVTEAYKTKGNIVFIIINHIVYIFFSYIIEFLSYIYYIEIFPDDFVIKKDEKISEVLHKIFFILNGIFLIIYNINNYFFILIANRPGTDKSYPLKAKIKSYKLYTLILFQNLSLVHPLKFYLKENKNKIWSIVYILVIFLLLIWLYFLSLKLYNFDNFINYFLSFIGEFCFASILLELLLYLLSIKTKNSRELVFLLFIKFMLSICLYFTLKKIYQKLMMKTIKKRLFCNNPCSQSFDDNMSNSVLFIRELFEQKNMRYLSKINGCIKEHTNQCSNYNCGCRIINNISNIKKTEQIAFIEDLIKKLNYYIETILIHYNYQNNFELSILLSEHFHLFQNNTILSYSILQTLIHNHHQYLTVREITIIYELMNKYIAFVLKQKAKDLNLEKYKGDKIILTKKIKELELRQFLNIIIKIKTSIKFMSFYSNQFVVIINHKDNYENSTFIKMDEIFNEIKYINSPYLNNKLLREIINYFSKEISYSKDITQIFQDLDGYSKLLPYEFFYKIFLFVDYFWNGEIPNNLLNIFYGFTSNRNLYSTEINPEIYRLLEFKYNEIFLHKNIKYNILLKISKGIKISYISESLIRKLNYNQSNLINNDLEALLIKDLAEPHAYNIKHYFILQQNYIFKDKFKFIFDNQGYMIESKINSTLQIGINKNILIIVTIEINPKSDEIQFYLNKNLNIISINKNFQDIFYLSLALIKEFKIELKELFGIDINDIDKSFKKDLQKIRKIREYKILDTKEYILKNLFKNKNQNNNYYINSKYIVNENKDKDEPDDENEEHKILKKEKTKKRKILNIFQKLIDNKSTQLFYIRPKKFNITKENFLLNLKKIFEKINSYEQDKLERKNIYKDYLKYTANYNELVKNKNMCFYIQIEPRLVYDTTFFYCRVDSYSIQNILENKNNSSYELKNVNTTTATELELNSTYNNSKIYDKREKIEKDKNINIFSDDIKFLNEKSKINKLINNNISYFREKLKANKTSKFRLCGFLLLCIFALLITCIITLNYQTELIQKDDKIFDALYYNYYQRTQFIYLNSIVLSIYYELLNISVQNVVEDNKDVLHLIGKNIELSHQLFIRYYMDFKIELNEDFSKLYEPLIANKISVSWENRVFHNDYNSELALIIYRILDSISHNFTENDFQDCEILLLEKYLEIDRKATPVKGNFIKLIYYLSHNYDFVLRQYFLSLEDSFFLSLNNFSKQTTSIYIVLEVIAFISFLLFFIINAYFLITSNKYIFQNILFMFIDFSQVNEYTFNNKHLNILIKKRISNYLLLLNEFTPKNLEALKKDKDIENRNSDFMNLKVTIDEEIPETSKDEGKLFQNKRNKKKTRKKKVYDKIGSNDSFVKDSTLNMNSQNYLLNNSNNSANNKGLKILNDDIHTLNNKDLINISNNNINSMNPSSNYFLNSSINQSHASNTNNMIMNGLNSSTYVDNNDRKSLENIEKSNKIKKNEVEKINKSKTPKIENEENKLTIEKVLFQTKVTMLNSIKVMLIIFIIFTLIFIAYYICKLIISLLFISNFQKIINDFKILTSQYNHIIRYWNNIKYLFILPNFRLANNLNETEEYFSDLNYRVKNVYKFRIKNYKRISKLYDIILGTSKEQNLSSINFCKNHTRCYDIMNSPKFLLSNGIESTVYLFSKEISNYYKDFLKLKDKIKDKEDIIKYFINDKYKILSSNINHVFIFLEELYFSYFLEDEKDIVNDFYLKIKILNIVEVCYCAILNFFSVLFVYNYVTKIISSVEVSSSRINCSIKRMKSLSIESNNKR